MSQEPLQVNSRSVQHVKIIDSFGTTQIIVRLGSEFERYTHLIMEDPPRLVIDVYNTLETVVETEETEGIIETDLSLEEGQIVSTIPREFSLQTLVIDPGHGGSDPGITIAPQTSDASSISEKDITLNLAKMLAISLGQRFGSIRVVLTREGDSFVSAEKRTTIANNNRADVFISLHVNNAPYPAVSGFEVYTMDYGSFDLPEGFGTLGTQSQLLDYAQMKYTESSKRLAQQIISAYDARNDGRSGTLKSAPLFTLKGATMPAVHIEIGYNSNPQDLTNILQEEFQQLLVAAITDGIAAFKKQEE
jgi:N-acetylmuramoyl-L-alanine amidase